MFLASLNQKQKDLFVQLCIHSALANGIVADEEAKIIQEYCKEMSIENPGTEAKVDLDEVLTELKAISSQQELNIIVFEIAALFVSDDEYSNREGVLMKKIIEVFQIEEKKVDTIFEHIKQYNHIMRGIIANLSE